MNIDDVGGLARGRYQILEEQIDSDLSWENFHFGVTGAGTLRDGEADSIDRQGRAVRAAGRPLACSHVDLLFRERELESVRSAVRGNLDIPNDAHLEVVRERTQSEPFGVDYLSSQRPTPEQLEFREKGNRLALLCRLLE